MITKEKHGSHVEMFRKDHSKELIDFMQTVTDIKEHVNFNVIVIADEPFSENSIASINFSRMYNVKVDNGFPELDTVVFNTYTTAQKIKELDATINSITHLVDSMDRIKFGLEGFLNYIKTIRDNLSG